MPQVFGDRDADRRSHLSDASKFLIRPENAAIRATDAVFESISRGNNPVCLGPYA